MRIRSCQLGLAGHIVFTSLGTVHPACHQWQKVPCGVRGQAAEFRLPTNPCPRVYRTGTQTRRSLLGNLGLPSSLVGEGQALQNWNGFGAQGSLWGPNKISWPAKSFREFPHFGRWGLGRENFSSPRHSFAFKFEVSKWRLLETFNFYLIIRISLQGIYLI